MTRLVPKPVRTRAALTLCPLATLCAAGALTGPAASTAAARSVHSRQVTIDVWLATRENAEQRYVNAASTPGSSSYRHFLGPVAVTRRFGPTPSQVSEVRAFLRRSGFTDISTSLDDVFVSATASDATVDRVLGAPARPGHDSVAHDRPPNDRTLRIPAAIRRQTLAVTGLGSGQAQPAATASGSSVESGEDATPRASATPCSWYWGQKTVTFSPAFDGITQAAVPVCGYSAQQMRAAYGLSGADTGAGKTIALVEVGHPTRMEHSLSEYARSNGLPSPRAGQYREVGVGQGPSSSACLNTAQEEAALDSEAAYAMAPRARQLMVDGNSCEHLIDAGQALFDALLVPLTGRGAKPEVAVESVSYELGSTGERALAPSWLAVGHLIALRAGAEGVSLLFSSGDDPGVEAPSSDPDVTAVGGTTLGIGAGDQRLFETGWSTLLGLRATDADPWQDKGVTLAGGGGTSSVYRQPSYQRSVVPASLARDHAGRAQRTVPDLSADADPSTGMLFGLTALSDHGRTARYETFRQAGTSTSTPLVAGIVTDAEQGRSQSFGFLNPTLYSLAGSAAFHDALPLTAATPQVDRAVYLPASVVVDHHVVLGDAVAINDAQDLPGTRQVTAPGYDTMTGLGSPNGSAFIDALRTPSRH